MADITVAAEQSAIADSLLGEPAQPDPVPPGGGDLLDDVQFGQQFPDQAEFPEQEVEQAQEPQEAEQQPEQHQQQLSSEQAALQEALANYQNLSPEQKEQVNISYMNDAHQRAFEVCDPHMSNLFTRGFGQMFGVPDLDQQIDSRQFAAFMFSWGENLLNTLAARQAPQQQAPARQSRSSGRQTQSGSRGKSGSPFQSNRDIFDNETLDAWARDHSRY